eukprot:contig_19468_g4790
MPLTTLEWEPPRYMPAYSRLSAAIVDELYAMCGRVNDPRPSLTANAKYVQRFDPVFFCDQLVMADCAHLQVKRTILPGQEVLAAYGRRYPLQEALGCQSQSASGGR